jgi:hypothetical protein
VFCCFALLCRPESLEAVVGIMPEQRRERLRPVLEELSGRPRSELVDRIKRLRQQDVVEGISRKRGERLSWEAMPAPLKRWVWEQLQEAHGRENH